MIVVGSDGLFDNIRTEELLEEIQKRMRSDGRLEEKQELAQSLAAKAIAYGQDHEYVSPFTEHAQAAGISFLGGKLDDTTVIIAQVHEDGEHVYHAPEWTPDPPTIAVPTINPYSTSEDEL